MSTARTPPASPTRTGPLPPPQPTAAHRGDRLPDIKPHTPVSSLPRDKYHDLSARFNMHHVCRVVGMLPTFVQKVCGRNTTLAASDVLALLDQDCYRETFVPRSRVLDYLIATASLPTAKNSYYPLDADPLLLHGHVLDHVRRIPRNSIRCVVTSTPYWALRLYKDPHFTTWSDREYAPYGHEQTPEGFVRHTIEILNSLSDVLTDDGSIWWNVMDSFNTRTQIRSSAVEALRAMQGLDNRTWTEYQCRRYSAGHSHLKDGEQCLIPLLIAERASRIGYYVKSVITWAKTSTLPEPQRSRVSRNLEYVIHLTKRRTPLFDKSVFRTLPPSLGGRNVDAETDKLSDVWILPTSNGRDGHGAQFPPALPGRCIALTTTENDWVLDPFVGAGTTGLAAKALGRHFIGIDVCKEYLETAAKRISCYTSRRVLTGLSPP